MANNYQDTTGELRITKITPVIQALFAGFTMGEPNNGVAYLAAMSEQDSPYWLQAHEAMAEMANLPDENIDTCVHAVCSTFGTKGEQAAEFILAFGEDDYQNPEDLLHVAQLLDDGHGLTAIVVETAWHCSKARKFEFGGVGIFASNHLTMSQSSYNAHHIGNDMDAAITRGDVDVAAKKLCDDILVTINGVHHEATRERIKAMLMEQLSQS